MKLGRLNITWGKKNQKLIPGRVVMNLFGLQVLWNNAQTIEIVEQGYADNPDIYTVVNRVTRTSAFAPFKVYKIKNQAKHLKYKAWTGENATPESIAMAMRIKSETYEEANEHPMNALLEQPNPQQKCREFTENSVGFKVITGERFWHITTGALGQPIAIYNLPPQHMTVIGDGTLLGVKEFQLMMGSVVTVPKEQVIFSRYWNPVYNTSGSHLRGLSPFKAGRKLMTISNTALSRQQNMLENAGAAGMLFEKPMQGMDGWSQEQAGKIKQMINTELIGTDNANAIGVANGDLGYLNFGIKGTEMELVELSNMNLNRICALLGVPSVLFNNDAATYNNLREAKKELLTAACFPELDSMRDDWNEIAKLYGDDIYIDYDASVYPELMEDMDKVVARAAAAWWTTPNEKRLMMYMDEDADELMDKFIVPSGMQLMEDLGMNEVDEELSGNISGVASGASRRKPSDE